MTAYPHPPREAPFDLDLPSIRIFLAALLLLGVVGVFPESASSAPAGFYVQATGHALADPFLGYWVENNGVRSLGLPVSDIVQRNGRTAQYFQYGVLVLKRNGAISRLRTGADLLETVQGDRRAIAGRRSPSPRTAQGMRSDDTVTQTRVVGNPAPPVIASDVRPYWQQHGGVEVLGNPISPAYRNGPVRTQWFEFGRIDLQPDGPVLAEIGLELAIQSGVPTSKADRGYLPLFDPERFVTFSGDGTVPNASGPFDPVRLEIPAIHVDAQIEITTVEDGVMTNPTDPWKAGWYAGFSQPGEWTNTVIAGHRDWWGYGPVVFWDLGLLRPGDTIYLLAADGTGATYLVESNTLVPRTVDPRPIIEDIGYEAVTLITCGGVWTGSEYTGRIIIRARRI